LRYYLRSLYFGRVLAAVVGDVFCFWAAALLTWFVAGPPLSPGVFALATLAATPFTVAALSLLESYRIATLGSARKTLPSIMGVMGVAFVAAMISFFFVPLPEGATPALAHLAVFYFGLLFVTRSGFRLVCSSPRFTRQVVVIGVSDLGIAIASALDPGSKLGIQLLGFLSDDEALQGERIAGVPVLGRVHQLEKLVRKARVDHVVVASTERDETFPAEQLLEAKLSGCWVQSGVEFYERLTGQLYVRGMRASYLIFSDGFSLGSGARRLQRAFDVTVASMGLLLSAPLMALSAAAIRLESTGPAFYRQVRLGRSGRSFQILKLRTMRVGAEDETGPVFACRDDRRVTRVGRILRPARIDELPQFWNVLLGDMSVVGPRPERPEFEQVLSTEHPYFRWRSSVKPGITGWAQIQHGYVNQLEEFEKKVALDLFYLKYRSLGMDLLIVWRTIKTVALFRGL
jgi:exopolysaccharide biosynthesis polyprenyl glycosylphosphotransferase